MDMYGNVWSTFWQERCCNCVSAPRAASSEVPPLHAGAFAAPLRSSLRVRLPWCMFTKRWKTTSDKDVLHPANGFSTYVYIYTRSFVMSIFHLELRNKHTLIKVLCMQCHWEAKLKAILSIYIYIYTLCIFALKITHTHNLCETNKT